MTGDGKRSLHDLADAAGEVKATAVSAHKLLDKLDGPTSQFATSGLPQLTQAIVSLQQAADSLNHLALEAQRSPQAFIANHRPSKWRSSPETLHRDSHVHGLGLAAASPSSRSKPALQYAFGVDFSAGFPAAAGSPDFNVLKAPTAFDAAAAGDGILTRDGEQVAYIAGGRWIARPRSCSMKLRRGRSTPMVVRPG